ncbi:hypothetical protein MJO29_009204 [Puccinia striiformis f. sp. tritici]|nr:hypothetical protein MJO29_009204 [Puccinia striiformis f. sp. tritici]
MLLTVRFFDCQNLLNPFILVYEEVGELPEEEGIKIIDAKSSSSFAMRRRSEGASPVNKQRKQSHSINPLTLLTNGEVSSGPANSITATASGPVNTRIDPPLPGNPDFSKTPSIPDSLYQQTPPAPADGASQETQPSDRLNPSHTEDVESQTARPDSSNDTNVKSQIARLDPLQLNNSTSTPQKVDVNELTTLKFRGVWPGRLRFDVSIIRGVWPGRLRFDIFGMGRVQSVGWLSLLGCTISWCRWCLLV